MTADADGPAAIFLDGVERAGRYWLAFFHDRPTDAATWQQMGGHALRALQWCATRGGLEALAADLAHELHTPMMRLGHWHDWGVLLERVIAQISPAADTERCWRLNAELSYVCFRMHRLDEALALAHRYHEIAVQQQNRVWQYEALTLMTEAHLNAGAFDLALHRAQEATALAVLLEDPTREADGVTNAARALLEQGEIAEAERRLERALALTVAAGDEVWQAKARLFLGHAACAQGQWGLALERYRAALAIVEGYGDQVGCGTILSAMGRALTELGAWDAAQRTLEESQQILRCHGNTPAAEVAQQRLRSLAARRKRETAHDA